MTAEKSMLQTFPPRVRLSNTVVICLGCVIMGSKLSAELLMKLSGSYSSQDSGLSNLAVTIWAP